MEKVKFLKKHTAKHWLLQMPKSTQNYIKNGSIKQLMTKICKSSMKNNMIRETYINFSIGVNLFDIWFQKHQYQ